MNKTSASASVRMAKLNQVITHENIKQLFINNPDQIPGQGQATVSFLYERAAAGTHVTDVGYSIVMPVHNQEEIIADNIASAIAAMAGPDAFECIMIFDGCEDNSEAVVKRWFEGRDLGVLYPRLDRVVLVHQSTSIFETAADNIGFVLSRGKYIIEIQADMKILTPGFNEILAAPCKVMPNVCGVSGRCCHAWSSSVGIGRLGMDFGVPGNIPDAHMKKFFVANTCNRGPLLLDRAKLADLGYLDQHNFYLEDSDHDYFARAYIQRGWMCGYTPIEVYAPMQHGSRRKPRNEENTRIHDFLKNRSNGGFFRANQHILKNAEHINVYDLANVLV